MGVAFVQLAAGAGAVRLPSPGTTANQTEDALADEFTKESLRGSDPFERLNRAVFTGNEHVYRVALRPLARGYERGVPRAIRKGLTNFFDNIRFPIRFVAALLQAKGSRALRESGRFAVNTTGGLGGLIRVSDEIVGLAVEPIEDMGQTFGRWGMPSGAFVVLPLLGPTSLRDFVGTIGDTILTPTNWTFPSYDEWKVRLAVQTTDGVAAMPGLLRGYDALRSGALDPYLAVRDAYLARRASDISR